MGFRVGVFCISLMLLGFVVGCGSLTRVPPQPRPPGDARAFASEPAWNHLEALDEIGARAAGTEEGERARAYIQDQLSQLGIRVEAHESTVPVPPNFEETLPVTNLIGVLPGDSSDLVILAASYDAPVSEDGASGGRAEASGAAVLLELAAELENNPLPYTTWFAFFDAEALRITGDPRQPSVALLGSTAFALNLAQQDVIDRVRLMVVLGEICDPQLQIARDLNSHRPYREEFFRAAARTGHSDKFPPDQGFQTPIASHRSFLPYGLRRVVALSEVERVLEPAEVPEDADSAEDAEIAEAPAPAQCTRESLEAVGVVVLDALDIITARLAKVDRFAKTPLAAIDDVVAVPAGAAASDREDEVEQEAATTQEAEPPSPEVEAVAVAEEVEEAMPQLAEVSDSTSTAALASTEEIVEAPASEAGGEPASQVQETASEADPWAEDEKETPEEAPADCGGRPCAWGKFPD
jgi:hypothetical protein